jgi:hypothetical protein
LNRCAACATVQKSAGITSSAKPQEKSMAALFVVLKMLHLAAFVHTVTEELRMLRFGAQPQKGKMAAYLRPEILGGLAALFMLW